MDDDNPRTALDATHGDTPSPEFVASLRRTLEQELAAQSDGTRTVTSDVSIVDTVLEPETEKPMDRNKGLLAIVGAAAAIIIVIVGVVVMSDDDKPDGEIDVIGEPDGFDDGTADEEGDVPDPTTTATTPPTAAPGPNWDFEITYIEVPAGNSVAADADSAWVATETGTLSRIDLATNTVADTYEIPTGANNTYFGFGTVWIGNLDGTVSRFDPETETITATIEISGSAPGWMEAGEDSMWTSNGSGGQALRIDPTTDTIIAAIELDSLGGAIKENSSGVWIRDFLGTVTRIDPATNTVVATIETPSGGGAMMASPGAVWAPGESGVVFRIDPETDSISAEIDVAAAIGGPAEVFGSHYVGGTFWVRYNRDGVHGVARIDPATNEVVAFQDFRPGWTRGGLNVGPTTAWTFNDDVVARMDFSLD